VAATKRIVSLFHAPILATILPPSVTVTVPFGEDLGSARREMEKLARSLPPREFGREDPQPARALRSGANLDGDSKNSAAGHPPS